MKTTITLANNFNTNPFYIFDRETDEVIMLINYYLAIGENEAEPDNSATHYPRNVGKNERIKVNDKTATGGWF